MGTHGKWVQTPPQTAVTPGGWKRGLAEGPSSALPSLGRWFLIKTEKLESS